MKHPTNGLDCVEVWKEKEAHTAEVQKLLASGVSPGDLAKMGHGKKARDLKAKWISAHYDVHAGLCTRCNGGEAYRTR